MQHGAVSKIVRDGLINVSVGKKSGKKRTITENMSNMKKPKTRWQRIKKWLTIPK
jgi:uncharacterized protein YdeI (YjbR/CyaY-like superfamily)